jgi:signal transduction histidine kinase
MAWQENNKAMLDSLETQYVPLAMEDPAASLVREAERRRIARDLHDGVVQSLTALVADLEYFRTRYLPMRDDTASRQFEEKVESWQSLARESLDSIREALGSLRNQHSHSTAGDQMLSSDCPFDLPRAIEAMLARMQERGYRIEFECEGWPVALPTGYASELLSIVREALNNISKHANASRITVALYCFESSLFLNIADDGIGMEQATSRGLAARQGKGYHQGLPGMRERAALMGGRMTIESIPSKGTRITLEIPLPRS